MKLCLLPVLAALAAMPVLAQDPAAPESATNAVPAEAAEAAPASAEAPDQTALEEWTHYIRQGGKTMWFIGLLSVLGLFGTVLGLLEAFGTVAAMGEMGDASVLADSIGKALVTTVAGLAVAMPALFVHQIVRNRLSLYSVILEDEIAGLVQRTVGAKR